MLRQQLALLQRQTKRPRLRWTDRLFWVAARRWLPNCREALVIVSPKTVCRRHRAGYRRLWRYPSHKRTGRKPVTPEVRELTCLVLIEHTTRKVVHVAVTRRATSKWVGEQVIVALKDHSTCSYLLRDNGICNAAWRSSRPTTTSTVVIAA